MVWYNQQYWSTTSNKADSSNYTGFMPIPSLITRQAHTVTSIGWLACILFLLCFVSHPPLSTQYTTLGIIELHGWLEDYSAKNETPSKTSFINKQTKNI